MQKFVDYVRLQETSAMSMGKSLMGGASNVNLDPNSEAAMDTAIQAFLLALGASPSKTIGALKNVVQGIPDVKDQVDQMLSQHDYDSLTDLRTAAGKAGKRIAPMISKGLGDVQSNNDMVSANSADSMGMKGEAYLDEAKVGCRDCKKEGSATQFEINAGKAKCKHCGAMVDKKPAKKKGLNAQYKQWNSTIDDLEKKAADERVEKATKGIQARKSREDSEKKDQVKEKEHKDGWFSRMLREKKSKKK